MKFEEALKALRQGKRVRQPCQCYYLLDDCKDSETIIDAGGDYKVFSSGEILAEDWEIIE